MQTGTNPTSYLTIGFKIWKFTDSLIPLLHSRMQELKAYYGGLHHGAYTRPEVRTGSILTWLTSRLYSQILELEHTKEAYIMAHGPR